MLSGKFCNVSHIRLILGKAALYALPRLLLFCRMKGMKGVLKTFKEYIRHMKSRGYTSRYNRHGLHSWHTNDSAVLHCHAYQDFISLKKEGQNG